MASPAFPDEIDIPICRFPSGRFIEEGDLSPTVHQHGVIQEFLRGTAALLTWIPEIRNESFDRVSPIIYFQEWPAAV